MPHFKVVGWAVGVEQPHPPFPLPVAKRSWEFVASPANFLHHKYALFKLHVFVCS